jgi:hypothetical protein
MFLAKIDRDYSNPLEKLQRDRQFPEVSLDFNMKTGYLIKRGFVRKNWKRRYFIAKNNAHNYCIEYYEDLEGKLKGIFECYGYKAEKFDGNDSGAFGQHGIKLVPYDSRRRVWMFRCATEEERGVWMHVFHTACCRASPPRLETNPLMVAAFARCHDMMLQHHHMRRPIGTLVGTEVDVLVDLCCSVARRKVLAPLLEAVPVGRVQHATTSFNDSVHGSMLATVTASWNNVTRRCKMEHAVLETLARSCLPRLMQERQKMLDAVWAVLGEQVSAALQDGVMDSLCGPLLAACGGAIEGYAAAEAALLKMMKTSLSSGKFASKELFDKMIIVTHKFVQWDSTGTGPLGYAQQSCWRMCLSESNQAAFAALFPDPARYSSYDFYCDLMDSIRDVAQRAVGAFASRSRERAFGGAGGGVVHASSPDRSRAGAKDSGHVDNNVYHTMKAVLEDVEGEFRQEVEAAFTLLLCRVLRDFVNECPEMRRMRKVLLEEQEAGGSARMASLESALRVACIDQSQCAEEGSGSSGGSGAAAATLEHFYSLPYLAEESLRLHIMQTLFGSVQEYALRSLFESRNSMMHIV